MSLILNIDTALDTASVCLARDGENLLLAINENPKDHAGWLQGAMHGMLEKSGFNINQLEAIAVSIGPGSYTGLRVGLASAKGLCYALNIPLITINTLKMMAYAVRSESPELICPMIDARRTEVFTAVYSKTLNEEIPPHTMMIAENSFDSLLLSHKILFCGNGSIKLKAFISNTNALFTATIANASHLAQLSHSGFVNKEFSDLIYTEPLYIKEFFLGARKA